VLAESVCSVVLSDDEVELVFAEESVVLSVEVPVVSDEVVVSSVDDWAELSVVSEVDSDALLPLEVPAELALLL
jgi:hypothetical protein